MIPAEFVGFGWEDSVIDCELQIYSAFSRRRGSDAGEFCEDHRNCPAPKAG